MLSCLHEKDKLKSAIPTLSLKSSLECETYQLGKHHLSTFSNYSLDSQSSSFDVVRTDIWNSSCTSTLNEFPYSVILFYDKMIGMVDFLKIKIKINSEFPYIVSKFL